MLGRNDNPFTYTFLMYPGTYSHIGRAAEYESTMYIIRILLNASERRMEALDRQFNSISDTDNNYYSPLHIACAFSMLAKSVEPMDRMKYLQSGIEIAKLGYSLYESIDSMISASNAYAFEVDDRSRLRRLADKFFGMIRRLYAWAR